MVTRRPRARPSASQVPSGTPTSVATAVALPDTRTDRSTTSSTGSVIGGAVPRAGIGEEQRLPVLRDPEAPDLPLRGGRGHPPGELARAAHVGARMPDDDDVVGVGQLGATLAEDAQVQVLRGEVGAPVGEGVGLLLAGDRQGLAHALAGPDVPAAAGPDPGPGPQGELLGVGARGVGAGRERRVGGRDRRERRRRRPSPSACAGSSLGPSRTKSLCITAARLSPWPCAMYVSSAAGECTSSTSASPLAPMASASPDPTATVLTRQRLPDSYARHQRVEQARVLGARRGAEDERPAGRRSRTCHAGRWWPTTTVAAAAGARPAAAGHQHDGDRHRADAARSCRTAHTVTVVRPTGAQPPP